jgi:hypothetical protein
LVAVMIGWDMKCRVTCSGCACANSSKETGGSGVLSAESTRRQVLLLSLPVHDMEENDMKDSSCCTRPVSSSHFMMGALVPPGGHACISDRISSSSNSSRRSKITSRRSRKSRRMSSTWRCDVDPVQDDRPNCKLTDEKMEADIALLITMTMMLLMLLLLVMLLLMLQALKSVA